jgi:murein DD-endopeptidase MepM/ murein hydrolase activator NlpD
MQNRNIPDWIPSLRRPGPATIRKHTVAVASIAVARATKAIPIAKKLSIPARNRMLNFMAQPIPLATGAYIMYLNAFNDCDRRLILSIFLSFAKHESEFTVDITAGAASSATGPLQLLSGTYRASVSKGQSMINQGPKAVASLVDTLFNNTRPDKGSKWLIFAHRAPGMDRTSPTAMIGLLRLEVDQLKRDWTFRNGSWEWNKAQTARSKTFIDKYSTYLRSYKQGFIAIISMMHAEGISWLSNKKKSDIWAPHYPKRVEMDVDLATEYYNSPEISWMLSKLGDAIAPSGAPGTGDPDDDKPVITGSFGKRKANASRGMMHSIHKGIDLRAPEGTKVFAVADGTIAPLYSKLKMGNWGNSIVLKVTNSPASYRYAHLSKFLVKSGDKVKKGDVIALSGHTGVKEPHLHFEYYPKGDLAVNPLNDPDGRWKFTLSPPGVSGTPSILDRIFGMITGADI